MVTEAKPTVDWRLPAHRQEVFLDFYDFHLRHRAHPGCVYYLMPYLRERYGWDPEEALWFAFLNGNTQNPVTSLILHRRSPHPALYEELLEFWQANYTRLAWDTDRRYHKKNLELAVRSYLALIEGYVRKHPGREQAAFWNEVALHGFGAIWQAATSITSFGRLSAFSYGEYLRIMGVDFDCDTLMLDDISGSRSHRNGLCIVTGRDEFDWHASNPEFDGCYPKDLLWMLADDAAVLLHMARGRSGGQPWARDVSYFTMESALCTYKSWHRPNRRYPNVYNDMLHDRILAAQTAFPDEDLTVFWQARAACLPPELRLECTPGDPGCVPVKQNWYRETGEVPMMGRDPRFEKYLSGFDDAVEAGELEGAPFR